MFRRSRENTGALPQALPGRKFLPGPRQLRMMHGCNFKQYSAVAGRTLGRCPRPRRGGSSSPGPATFGWYKTYFSNCAPQQRMERRTAAPGQAGFAGPPVRKRTGKRLEISRKTSSLVFSEIPSLFFCPGALLATE